MSGLGLSGGDRCRGSLRSWLTIEISRVVLLETGLRGLAVCNIVSVGSNAGVANTYTGNKGCKDLAGNNPCCPYQSRTRSADVATAPGRWGGRGWPQVWVPRQGVGGSRRHCKNRKTITLLASPQTRNICCSLSGPQHKGLWRAPVGYSAPVDPRIGTAGRTPRKARMGYW